MQETKSNSASDKITPISFSALLTVFFADAYQMLKLAVAFIFGKKILIGIATIIGLAIGYYFYKSLPATYKLSLIVRPTEMSEKVFGEMLKNLDDLAGSGSHSELSKNLKINEGTSSKIIKISGINIQDIALTEDTAMKNNRPFSIQLLVRDNSIGDSLQTAIVSYFNNNTYLNKLKNDKIAVYNSKLAFIDSELRKLDSLKEIYNSFLAQSKTASMYYNNAMDPAKVYDISSKYLDEKGQTLEWLSQNREVLVLIDGIKPSQLPFSTGMTRFVLLYGAAFFFIGCLIGIIYDSFRKRK